MTNELKDEQMENAAAGISRNEAIAFIKLKIASLERDLLLEDDPKEIENIKHEIEQYKKILYELTK